MLFRLEVFIQELLFRAAVVLDGTRFSTMRRAVSLKSAQSCSMGQVDVKSAAKTSAYSCRSSPVASTSALFQRNRLRGGGVSRKSVSEVSYKTISWSLYPREGNGLQRPSKDGCVVMIRSKTLSFLVGKSTICSRSLLFTMSRMV